MTGTKVRTFLPLRILTLYCMGTKQPRFSFSRRCTASSSLRYVARMACQTSTSLSVSIFVVLFTKECSSGALNPWYTPGIQSFASTLCKIQQALCPSCQQFFAVRHYLLVRDYKRTDYKQKAFFKRSFNGRKDKTVFISSKCLIKIFWKTHRISV